MSFDALDVALERLLFLKDKYYSMFLFFCFFPSSNQQFPQKDQTLISSFM